MAKKALEALTLGELQRLFKETVGEATRCPNKTFLIRRIKETRTGQGATETRRVRKTAIAKAAAVEPVSFMDLTTPFDDPVSETTSERLPARGRFAGMTIDALQAEYIRVVGRESSSNDRGYLCWKIREAEKGHVRVGPRVTRADIGDAVVLPLRLRKYAVEVLDAAWKGRQIPSRNEFFRRATVAYLRELGAFDAAEAFAANA